MSSRGRNHQASDLELPASPTNTGNASSAEWSPESSASSMSNSSSVMTVEDSSCVSCKAQNQTEITIIRAMPLVGCPRCLMYVMSSEVDPKCPNCKNTVFLYFLNDAISNTNHFKPHN